MSARSDAALREWLDELPALTPSLDGEAGPRGVLLREAASTGNTLLRAAKTGHPVLLGHAHLSVAALELTLAYDGDERARRVTQALDHAETAAGIATKADAPAVRLDLLPRASALLAGCLSLSPKTKTAALERRLTELAGVVGAAMTEQNEQARTGMATLAAAMTLGDGAKLVRQPAAKQVVLERAAGLADQARLALVRAGELRKADLAAEVAHQLRARLTG